MSVDDCQRDCLFADFVMYIGDLITANNLPNHDATTHWLAAVGPAVDRNIPFASLFGNHDDAAFVWDPASGMPDSFRLQFWNSECSNFLSISVF